MYQIRILIADDHAVVRKGLKQILSEAANMIVASEARNGFEVLAKAAEEKFDVIVLDMSMPGKSGLDLIKDIRQRHPKLPILILSIYPEEQYAVRVLKAGASGYIGKDSPPEELVKAIRKVASGGKYVSAQVAEKLADHLGKDGEELPHEQLSDREYQVLCLISSGKSTKEIAQSLSLSIKTVSTYRTRILEKMEMKSNAEMIRYGIRNNLVE